MTVVARPSDFLGQQILDLGYHTLPGIERSPTFVVKGDVFMTDFRH